MVEAPDTVVENAGATKRIISYVHKYNRFNVKKKLDQNLWFLMSKMRVQTQTLSMTCNFDLKLSNIYSIIVVRNVDNITYIADIDSYRRQ